MQSRALDLALALNPEDVVADDDRALVAEVFEASGLPEEAEAWRVEASSEAVDEDDTGPQPEPEPERTLRVVGGRADDGAFVVLPAPTEKTLGFRGVGGLEDVKRDIERRIIAPFKQSSLLARFKKRAGGGVLLYGPPGCGKTLIARATAGECGFEFVPVKISDVLDSPVGASERHLSSFFERARRKAPAVLFFDEIDALASKRTTTSATHQAQLVSHFLAEMDGVDAKNEGVLLLAATNIPWAVDSAFLRPGRFDRMFFIPPPDRSAREAILKLELGERPITSGLRVEHIAASTSGLSGADLALIVEQAADLAIDATLARGKEVPINDGMLAQAARGVHSSVTDWLTTARNHATYANESGRYDDVLSFLKKHGH
ncbi:MAG: ATP-binding protein [Pseudomonadota bacterium]